MLQNKFSFEEFSYSSQIIRDLVSKNQKTEEFIGDFFSLDSLSKQADKKEFTSAQRLTLVDRLNAQNEGVSLSARTAENIEALRDEKTVTITTGHQLNLMTGPLYSIYKVAQVISLCSEMNGREDGFNYVPVFWMATEDHDFDEINHIHLFGQKIAWEKEGQESKIVGAVEPAGISDFTREILEKYRDDESKQVISQFTNAYDKSENLAQATREIMNHLFAKFGLVILDGNDVELKKQFAPVAKKEVEEAFVFEAVNKANHKLSEKGYHNQVYVRNCNLFYIDQDKKRIRISKESDRFEIDEQFYDANELLAKIDENSAAFSPNALLRPVYQEIILPNVAYIGGGGEIAYWLQLKGVFDQLNLEFPLLRVRDSLLLLKEREVQEIETLNLSILDLKRDFHELLKEIALQDVAVEIELTTEKDQLKELKTELLKKAERVAKGMGGLIEAEFSKMEKSIERIEAKLIKAEKGKHEQKAKKIKKMQTKIFPNGGFQERYENFLPYFLADSDFVSKIVDNLTPSDEPTVKVVLV